ncbi:aldo/keto reductase [Mesorhizobium sp. B2-4-12]|uniref:aldo/keto reductase n=1 Tax=Mesorhizobium sp. B2-4-12 TaxID=2589937 RepID=UPI001128C746|nr:aldo/keto reductase [Mesorhizobium sp. B2-4-12]TPK97702.1 aldo/keto reductase [Mesorhizobium sp. B2-4-12]
MKRHPIGQTGLEVTEICFGTAPLGGMPDTYGYNVDEATALATIRAIFDGPVNFMDTSRNYGFGRSEERIGSVIRERGGLPPGFVLSTKLDRDMGTGRFDAGRARQSLEESLLALGLDRVHILHLHDPEHSADLDEITRPGGAFDELIRMKEEGLATAVGLAMGRLDIMLPMVRDWPLDVLLNHNRFTLLNRSASDLFDLASERGVAVLNAAPYAGGVLAKGSSAVSRITYQEIDEIRLTPVRQVEAVCKKHAVAPGAVAIQFSLNDPRITSTVVGVSKPERVAQTIDWATAKVPDQAWAELGEVGYSVNDPEAERIYKPG